MEKKNETQEKREIAKKIHHLEFINDQLTAEITYLDQLMRQIGFTDGLETIKASAREIISQENLPGNNNTNFPVIE